MSTANDQNNAKYSEAVGVAKQGKVGAPNNVKNAQTLSGQLGTAQGGSTISPAGATKESLSADLTVHGTLARNVNSKRPGTFLSTVGVDEVQLIAFAEPVFSGSFAISFSNGGASDVTANLDVDVSAATMESALEGLSTIGVGNVSVVGNGPGGTGVSYDVTFGGSLSKLPLNQMTLPVVLASGEFGLAAMTSTNIVQGLADAYSTIPSDLNRSDQSLQTVKDDISVLTEEARFGKGLFGSTKNGVEEVTATEVTRDTINMPTNGSVNVSAPIANVGSRFSR